MDKAQIVAALASGYDQAVVHGVPELDDGISVVIQEYLGKGRVCVRRPLQPDEDQDQQVLFDVHQNRLTSQLEHDAWAVQHDFVKIVQHAWEKVSARIRPTFIYCFDLPEVDVAWTQWRRILSKNANFDDRATAIRYAVEASRFDDAHALLTALRDDRDYVLSIAELITHP